MTDRAIKVLENCKYKIEKILIVHIIEELKRRNFIQIINDSDYSYGSIDIKDKELIFEGHLSLQNFNYLDEIRDRIYKIPTLNWKYHPRYKYQDRTSFFSGFEMLFSLQCDYIFGTINDIEFSLKYNEDGEAVIKVLKLNIPKQEYWKVK